MAHFKSNWPMSKLNLIKKSIAITVSVSFILPTLTFAFQPGTYPADAVGAFGFTPFKVNGQTLKISPKHGMITSSFKGKSNKTVIYIQDLHCHYEVQDNIHHIIKSLVARNGLALVGVEGESKPVDVSIISSIENREVKQGVGDYFIKRGRLTGPEYTASIGDKPITLAGIETQQLYDYSKEKLLEFLTDENQGYIEDLRYVLEKLKRPLYTTELAKMDHQKEQFNYEQISLESYCSYLLGEGKRLGVDYRPYSGLRTFSQNHSLPTEGAVDYENLMHEAYQFEQKLRNKLYTSHDQRKLDHYLNQLRIMESMINISATEQDLTYYRNQREQFSLPKITQFLDDVCYRFAIDTVLDPGVIKLEQALDKAEEFYLAADKRSNAFIKNLLLQMNQREQQVAVLITGGFHAAEVEQSMRRKGLTYVAIKPRITRTDVPNPYFNVLKGRLTPIEKLIKQHETLLAPVSVLNNALYRRYINVVKNIISARLAANAGNLDFSIENFKLRPDLSNSANKVFIGQFENDPDVMVVIGPNRATNYPTMVGGEVIAEGVQLQFVHREVWNNKEHRAAIVGSAQVARETGGSQQTSQVLSDLFDISRYLGPLRQSQGWLNQAWTRTQAVWNGGLNRGKRAWAAAGIFISDTANSFNFNSRGYQAASIFLGVMIGGSLAALLGVDVITFLSSAGQAEASVAVLEATGLTNGPQLVNPTNSVVPNGKWMIGIATFTAGITLTETLRRLLGSSAKVEYEEPDLADLYFPNQDDLIQAANLYAGNQLSYDRLGLIGETGFIESLKTVMALSEKNQDLQDYISNRADRLALAGIAFQNGRLPVTEDLPTGRALSFAKDFMAGERLAEAILEGQEIDKLELGNSHLAQLIAEIKLAKAQNRTPVFQLGFKDGLSPERLHHAYFTPNQIDAIKKLVSDNQVELTWSGISLNPIVGIQAEPEQARALLVQQLNLANLTGANELNLPLAGNQYVGLAKIVTTLAAKLNIKTTTSDQPTSVPTIWSENVTPAMRELISNFAISHPQGLNGYLTNVMNKVAIKDGRQTEDKIEVRGVKKAEYIASGAVKHVYRIVVDTNIGEIAIALRFIQQPVQGELYDGQTVYDYIPFIGREIYNFQQIADQNDRPRVIKAVFDRNKILNGIEDEATRNNVLEGYIEQQLDGIELGLYHEGVTLDELPLNDRPAMFRRNVALMASTWKDMQSKVKKKMRGFAVNDMKPQNFVYNAELERVDYIDLDKTDYVTANRFMQLLDSYFQGNVEEFSIWTYVKELGNREELYSQIIFGGLLDGWGAEEFMRRMDNYALQQLKFKQRPAFYQQVREFIIAENSPELLQVASGYTNFIPEDMQTTVAQAQDETQDQVAVASTQRQKETEDRDDTKVTEIKLAEIPKDQTVDELTQQAKLEVSERGPPAGETTVDQPTSEAISASVSQTRAPRTENITEQELANLKTNYNQLKRTLLTGENKITGSFLQNLINRLWAIVFSFPSLNYSTLRQQDEQQSIERQIQRRANEPEARQQQAERIFNTAWDDIFSLSQLDHDAFIKEYEKPLQRQRLQVAVEELRKLSLQLKNVEQLANIKSFINDWEGLAADQFVEVEAAAEQTSEEATTGTAVETRVAQEQRPTDDLAKQLNFQLAEQSVSQSTQEALTALEREYQTKAQQILDYYNSNLRELIAQIDKKYNKRFLDEKPDDLIRNIFKIRSLRKQLTKEATQEVEQIKADVQTKYDSNMNRLKRNVQRSARSYYEQRIALLEDLVRKQEAVQSAVDRAKGDYEAFLAKLGPIDEALLEREQLVAKADENEQGSTQAGETSEEIQPETPTVSYARRDKVVFKMEAELDRPLLDKIRKRQAVLSDGERNDRYMQVLDAIEAQIETDRDNLVPRLENATTYERFMIYNELIAANFKDLTIPPVVLRQLRGSPVRQEKVDELNQAVNEIRQQLDAAFQTIAQLGNQTNINELTELGQEVKALGTQFGALGKDATNTSGSISAANNAEGFNSYEGSIQYAESQLAELRDNLPIQLAALASLSTRIDDEIEAKIARDNARERQERIDSSAKFATTELRFDGVPSMYVRQALEAVLALELAEGIDEDAYLWGMIHPDNTDSPDQALALAAMAYIQGWQTGTDERSRKENAEKRVIAMARDHGLAEIFADQLLSADDLDRELERLQPEGNADLARMIRAGQQGQKHFASGMLNEDGTVFYPEYVLMHARSTLTQKQMQAMNLLSRHYKVAIAVPLILPRPDQGFNGSLPIFNIHQEQIRTRALLGPNTFIVYPADSSAFDALPNKKAYTDEAQRNNTSVVSLSYEQRFIGNQTQSQEEPPSSIGSAGGELGARTVENALMAGALLFNKGQPISDLSVWMNQQVQAALDENIDNLRAQVITVINRLLPERARIRTRPGAPIVRQFSDRLFESSLERAINARFQGRLKNIRNEFGTNQLISEIIKFLISMPALVPGLSAKISETTIRKQLIENLLAELGIKQIRLGQVDNQAQLLKSAGQNLKDMSEKSGFWFSSRLTKLGLPREKIDAITAKLEQAKFDLNQLAGNTYQLTYDPEKSDQKDKAQALIEHVAAFNYGQSVYLTDMKNGRLVVARLLHELFEVQGQFTHDEAVVLTQLMTELDEAEVAGLQPIGYKQAALAKQRAEEAERQRAAAQSLKELKASQAAQAAESRPSLTAEQLAALQASFQPLRAAVVSIEDAVDGVADNDVKLTVLPVWDKALKLANGDPVKFSDRINKPVAQEKRKASLDMLDQIVDSATDPRLLTAITGFRETVEQVGLTLEEEQQKQGGYFGEQTENILRFLLKGFFESNDELSGAVRQVAIERGLATTIETSVQLAKITVKNLFSIMQPHQIEAFYGYIGINATPQSIETSNRKLKKGIDEISKTLGRSTYAQYTRDAKQKIRALKNNRPVKITVNGQEHEIKSIKINKLNVSSFSGPDQDHANNVGAFMQIQDDVAIINVLEGTDYQDAIMHEFLEYIVGMDHNRVLQLMDYHKNASIGKINPLKQLWYELRFPSRNVSRNVFIGSAFILATAGIVLMISTFPVGIFITTIGIVFFLAMWSGYNFIRPKKAIFIGGSSNNAEKMIAAQALSQYRGYSLIDTGMYYRTLAQVVLEQDPEFTPESLSSASSKAGAIAIINDTEIDMPFDRSWRQWRTKVLIKRKKDSDYLDISHRVLPELVESAEEHEYYERLEAIASEFGKDEEFRKIVNARIRVMLNKRPLIITGRTIDPEMFAKDQKNVVAKFFIMNNNYQDRVEKHLGRSLKPGEEIDEILEEIQANDLKELTAEVDPLRTTPGLIPLNTSELSPRNIANIISQTIDKNTPYIPIVWWRWLVKQINNRINQVTNKAIMLDRADGEVVRAEKIKTEKGNGWKIFTDLDSLSAYNDIYGKTITNYILQDILDIRAKAAQSDFVKSILARRGIMTPIRHGGDEGIDLLPGELTAEEVQAILDYIRKEVSFNMHKQFKIYNLNDSEIGDQALLVAKAINNEFKDNRLIRVAKDPFRGPQIIVRTGQPRGVEDEDYDKFIGQVKASLSKQIDPANVDALPNDGSLLLNLFMETLSTKTVLAYPEPVRLLNSDDDERFDVDYLSYLKEGWILTPTLSGGATKANRVLSETGKTQDEPSWLEKKAPKLFKKIKAGQNLTEEEYLQWSEVVYELAGEFLHLAKDSGKNEIVVDDLTGVVPAGQEQTGKSVFDKNLSKKITTAKTLFRQNLILGDQQDNRLYDSLITWHYSIDGLKYALAQKFASTKKGIKKMVPEVYIGRAPPSTGPDKMQLMVVKDDVTHLIEIEGRYYGDFIQSALDKMKDDVAEEIAKEIATRDYADLDAEAGLVEAKITTEYLRRYKSETEGFDEKFIVGVGNQDQPLYKFKVVNDGKGYVAGDEVISGPHIIMQNKLADELIKKFQGVQVETAITDFLEELESDLNNNFNNDVKFDFVASYATLPTEQVEKNGPGELFRRVEIASMVKTGKISAYSDDLLKQTGPVIAERRNEKILKFLKDPQAQEKLFNEAVNDREFAEPSQAQAALLGAPAVSQIESMVSQVITAMGLHYKGNAIAALTTTLADRANQIIDELFRQKDIEAKPMEQTHSRRVESLRNNMNTLLGQAKANAVNQPQLLAKLNQFNPNTVALNSLSQLNEDVRTDSDLIRLGAFNLNGQVYLTDKVIDHVTSDKLLAAILFHEAGETVGISHEDIVSVLDGLGYTHQKLVEAAGLETQLALMKAFKAPTLASRVTIGLGMAVIAVTFVALITGALAVAGITILGVLAVLLVGAFLVTTGLTDYIAVVRQTNLKALMSPNVVINTSSDGNAGSFINMLNDQKLGVVAQPGAFTYNSLAENFKASNLGRIIFRIIKKPFGMSLPIIFAPFTNSLRNQLLNAGVVSAMWVALAVLTGGIINSEAGVAFVALGMIANNPANYFRQRVINNPEITSIAVYSVVNSEKVSEAINLLERNWTRQNLANLYAKLGDGFANPDIQGDEEAIAQLLNMINSVTSISTLIGSKQDVNIAIGQERHTIKLPKMILNSPSLLNRVKKGLDLRHLDTDKEINRAPRRNRMSLGGSA